MSAYYHRNLPHYHPDNVALFMTFRLAGSLPLGILTKLKTERKLDKQKASESRQYLKEKNYFDKYDTWLYQYKDSPKWLSQSEIACIVASKIEELSGKYYHLLAYCIMPNHVHMLIINKLSAKELSPQGKFLKYPVANSLRLLKGSTARKCNQALKRSGAFWQHESYDHVIRNKQELDRIIHYILNNPVKAGLVKEWKDWAFVYVNPEMGEW